ncbi:MAG: HAMP domain-containing protein [Gemmatimonadetes bacterium]|nr:HAMP domain-containing protein [Gemmatimonadota bacterium]
MKVSLKSALMGLVLLVLLLGLVPTGILLDRRLTAALEEGVRDDLRTAPLVLADRWQNQASARMMHSREMAIDPDLVAAMTRSDTVSVLLRAEEIATAFPGESAVVIGPDGVPWMGPDVEATVVDSTRAGAMPVLAMESEEHGLGTISLAPVVADGGWMGAVGVWVPMTEDEAARLSVLTRSDVLLMAPDEELAAYTGRAEPAMGLFGLLAQQPVTDDVREFELDGDRYLVANAHVPGGARVSFVRALSEELAVVPTLRAVGAGVFGLALVVALAVGVWFATRLAEPVGSLAGAASRISQGDFDAPVGRSAVDEVDKVAEAFEVMRDALAVRIKELAEANQALEDRQERLSMLQAELVQRDRLSAASRLLAQLAHEVRNPVASVRNCLEVLRRRVEGDEEASELADLAIDELLRMHELAEQMLDLHRPRSGDGDCDAMRVSRDVMSVVRVGLGDQDIDLRVDGPEHAFAEIPGDALKQVLLNLVQNAQDALAEGGTRGTIEVRVVETGANVRIDVVDDGPGITDEALPQLFDPFFTTKADVQGVGLGLFTAAGLVRSHGGRIAASNRPDGKGARLTVEVPRFHAGRSEVMA